MSQDGLHEDLRKAWQERAKLLRVTLAKIEAGEIGSLDPRGFFVCSICGQQGLGLLQILQHEEQCRERLSAEGHVPQSTCREETRALQLSLAYKLAALKAEVAEAAVANGHDPGELLSLSLDRLRDVAKNACFREEKKYRRLRMSNAAVAEAIGRWKAAVELLEAIGFEQVMHTSKTGGDSEPHLIMASQLGEASFKAYLDVLDGKEIDAGSSILEECQHCKRKFRFDRIAKHETRCPESKAKPPKLDVVAKLLAGTPGEKHIPEVRRSIQNGITLPPLVMKHRENCEESDGLQECARCKRRFSAEAMEKHARRCTATPGASSLGSRRLNPLQSETAETAQPPESASRPSSSRHKDAGGMRSINKDLSGNLEVQEIRKESKRGTPGGTPRGTPRGTRDNSETSEAPAVRSGSRGSRGSRASHGQRERVQRPLTPKRGMESMESVKTRSTSSTNTAGNLRPGYPNGHSAAVQTAQPSYEQLELDVADWLDE